MIETNKKIAMIGTVGTSGMSTHLAGLALTAQRKIKEDLKPTQQDIIDANNRINQNVTNKLSFMGTCKSAKLGPISMALLSGEPLSPVMQDAAIKLGYIKDKNL